MFGSRHAEYEYNLFQCTVMNELNNLLHTRSGVSSWPFCMYLFSITNKLKIKEWKTGFIVFRSPQLRCGLSANVGESQLTQYLKVKDLGIIFHQFLNFYYHIIVICRLNYCNSIVCNVPTNKTDLLQDYNNSNIYLKSNIQCI